MRELVQMFLGRLAQSDFVAVVDDDGEHFASEIVAEADNLAESWGGGGADRTVLVQADNSWRTVAAAVAVGRAGGVIALVSRHKTAVELAQAFDDIRPDTVVVAPDAWTEWEIQELLPGFTSGTALSGWVVAADTPTGVRRWRGGSVIGMTSGSTGRAKGVVQSAAAVQYAGQQTIRINHLETGDPIAAIVPLSSSAAFTFGVAISLALAGPLVTAARWRPPGMLARIRQHRVKWLMCVPTMALQLGRAAADDDPGDSMSSMTVGGGPMDVDALRRAETSLHTKILRVFGMSECLGHTSPAVDDPSEVRLARDGRPFDGTSVRAVDADGLAVPAGSVGRAQVKGPSLFLGYARGGTLDPVVLTPDGFFPTGDMVRLNSDGTINIMGREKDIIIRGGRNIDVLEVEVAVASHPDIEMVCVVPLPDPEMGERVGILVVPNPGCTLNLGSVLAHLAQRGLSKTNWPEYLFQVEALPQTTVGKLSRPAAKELALRLHSAADNMGALR